MRIKKIAAAVLLGISALGLSACATGLRTQVSRYQAMPAPQGQSFVIVPQNPSDMGGLEFSRYAELVAQQMQAQGYARAPSINQATMVVQVGYGVGDAQTEIVTYPSHFGYGYGGWGYPFYYGHRPYYWGWADPFWFGYDDNRAARLSGAAAALPIFGDLMADLDPEPLKLPKPDGVEIVAIDPETGLRGSGCPGAYEVPFVAGSAPEGRAPCADNKTVERVKGWLERIFGR